MAEIDLDTNIPSVWNKFERWERRYMMSGKTAIERIIRKGYSKALDQIPFSTADEFLRDLDHVEDFGYTRKMLQKRLQDRIDFFRKYLVDISFDGPEFMQKKSEFIWKQTTRENKTLSSIWLVQDRADRMNSIYPDIPKADISFLCRDISEVDLASMYSSLPFNRIFAWQPKRLRWDVVAMNEFIEKVHDDLSFDYDVEISPSHVGSDETGYSHIELDCLFTA